MISKKTQNSNPAILTKSKAPPKYSTILTASCSLDSRNGGCV